MELKSINLKSDKKLIEQANKVAQNLGFSLEDILNAYLKQIVRSKTIFFSLNREEPTEYFLRLLQKSDQEYQNGEFKSFNNIADFTKSLDK